MDYILGAHMSIAKGFAKAAELTHSELACNAMQVFLKSPRSNRYKPLNPEDVNKFKANVKEYDIQYVCAHASYLLNFAKPLPEDDPWQLNNIKDDLAKLAQIGGHGLVYHVGKYLKLDPEEARQILIENLQEILETAKKHNVKLLLENCAGQGTEMGKDLLEIAEILEALNHEHIGVCLDTCHAFAAGYNLSEKTGVDEFFTTVDKTITWDKVGCIHFNESKMPLASNRDRHANLDAGEIGTKGMRYFAKRAIKINKPIILETPLIEGSHKKDIDIFKAWFA